MHCLSWSGAAKENRIVCVTALLSFPWRPADSGNVKPDRRIRSASVTMNVEGRRKSLRIRPAEGDGQLFKGGLRMWRISGFTGETHRREIVLYAFPCGVEAIVRDSMKPYETV